MINKKLKPDLIYQQGYLTTCCLYRLLPDELLVNFILSVNFAALLYDTIDAHQMGAREVINGFRETTHQLPVTGAGIKSLHAKCLKIIDPIVDHPELSIKAKKVQLATAIVQCWQIIEKRKDVKQTILLPDNYEVTLPVEFMVVCFLCGMEPLELLQYFINRISIVRDLASQHFCPEYNPCSAFVNTALDKYAPTHEPLIALEHQRYLKKMLLLNDEMKGEPDHQKRYRKFEKLVKQWCRVLQKAPLNRGILSVHVHRIQESVTKQPDQ